MAAYTTIDDPSLYFTSKLYTSTYSSGGGTGATINVTLDATDDFAVDLVWIKCRSVGDNHLIADRVRGANKNLHTNTDDAETTNTDEVTAFGDDGFTVGNNDTVNRDGASSTYVAWCWKESATAGFDIVTYTGNGSGTRGISHSLSAVPHCFIVKGLASSRSWPMYHHTLGNTKYAGYLDSAGASGTYEPFWADTTPTSSVFTVDTDSAVNANTESYLAYLWSEKQGFSKFGSYIGNGNADSTFVYLGFRPAWVMIKRTTGSTYNWMIFDNKRNTFNVIDDRLRANTNDAEQTGSSTHILDFVSNGFKIRSSNSAIGGGGDPYVYMAFAEAPFVNSNGVPCNAR